MNIEAILVVYKKNIKNCINSLEKDDNVASPIFVYQNSIIAVFTYECAEDHYFPISDFLFLETYNNDNNKLKTYHLKLDGHIDEVIIPIKTLIKDYIPEDEYKLIYPKLCYPAEFFMKYSLFLLSNEEYEAVQDNITKYCPVNDWWWLCSPGEAVSHCSFVDEDGYISEYGLLVDSECAIRPACKLSNHESSHLAMGDCIMKYGYPFIKISEELAIAEFPIGVHRFDKILTEYEFSEIKNLLFRLMSF